MRPLFEELQKKYDKGFVWFRTQPENPWTLGLIQGISASYLGIKSGGLDRSVNYPLEQIEFKTIVHDSKFYINVGRCHSAFLVSKHAPRSFSKSIADGFYTVWETDSMEGAGAKAKYPFNYYFMFQSPYSDELAPSLLNLWPSFAISPEIAFVKNSFSPAASMKERFIYQVFYLGARIGVYTHHSRNFSEVSDAFKLVPIEHRDYLQSFIRGLR